MGFDHTQQIRTAQVRLLYEQSLSALTATGVNAAILAAVLWSEVSRPLLLVWLFLIFVVGLGRYQLLRAYLRDQSTGADSLRWGRRYIYGVAANGVLWGFAGFFFFTELSYFHQTFLAFVLAGMVCGGISTLSPVRGAYLAFLIPALIPYVVRLVSIGTGLHLAMGGMLLLFTALMWMISRRLYTTVTESLRLRFDNLDLLHDLTQARHRLELVNEELVDQVAEKRHAQEALQESYSALEQRVHERTEELAQSEEALRDAARRKDEFLAMLGHELRNPLAPIRNAVQLMQRPDVSDSMVTWGREVIERQIDHLARLVDDLLDVSRIVHGKIGLQETLIQVATVIDHAVEASRPLIEERHQVLSVSLPDKPLWVRGDLVRLAQVISNLLNNAAKYTDIGGHIQLHIKESEQWVTLRVQDNGVGIPANLLPYVFDLFAQADPRLARTQGGMGIGLTLVKRLIEMHGGRVEARSAGTGHGSEFLVHLPLQAVQVPPETHASQPKVIAASEVSRRVLVVDDNKDAAESLAILMRLEGHTVEVACDGATALAEAARFKPEAVLLDIGMPGMDGYQIIRELRAREPMRSAVILALTGYGQPEDRARAKAAGFTDHLTKPVNFGLLLKMLNANWEPLSGR